jgi:glycosyltransferase involved in cell wall biosynthesis
MKICYFADADSIHVVRWCKHFAALGHEVHLISFKNTLVPDTTLHYIDAGNIAVKGGNWRVLLSYKKVKAILKKIQPDIFHSHYATSYGITGALCGFHPYIITALGSDVLISPKNSKTYKLLLKYAFSKADWITAMADHMKKAIEEIGIHPSKVETVPFGIDAAIFNSKSRLLPVDSFVITSTRNFEPVYNLRHLILAVGKAKANIPNIQLNLIGDGSLKGELNELINECGLISNTTFFGKVTQAKISETLNKSHLFVSVSLSDGNNISLNEAMACGAYCIATDIPANTQWITNGENGFLVKVNDIDDLANKIVISYQNYEQLQKKVLPLNETIIAAKAIWQNNMKIVEEKYKQLSKSK